MSVNNYSLWQVFVFYSSYTGVFLLGINDGFIIKNAGKEYKELNKEQLFLKFCVSFCLELILGVLIFLFIVVFNIKNRLFIYISLVLYMVFQNSFALIGSYHQATNNNKLYSKGCILERIVFLLLLLIALFFNLNEYFYFILFNLLSVFISLVYLYIKSNLKLKIKFTSLTNELCDVRDDIQVGFKIMLANLSGTLIMGGCRMLIDNNWDITIFGKVCIGYKYVAIIFNFC